MSDRYKIDSIPKGSRINPRHMERLMRQYPVLESELDSISTHNGLASLFSTLGVGLGTFALGIWADAIFAITKEPSSPPSPAVYFVCTVCGAVALVCLGAWFYCWSGKRAEIRRIKEGSSEIRDIV